MSKRSPCSTPIPSNIKDLRAVTGHRTWGLVVGIILSPVKKSRPAVAKRADWARS
jgi:hypothetical protein